MRTQIAIREPSLNTQDFSSAGSPTQGMTCPPHRCIRQNKIKFGSQGFLNRLLILQHMGENRCWRRPSQLLSLERVTERPTPSQRRGHIFSNHVRSPSGARNKECLCWRRPASNLLLSNIISQKMPTGNYMPIFFHLRCTLPPLSIYHIM
jgi:hypothetical protein